MTEWGVYLVVVSLLAAAAMVAKPVSALTRTNTRLECALDRLADAVGRLQRDAARLDSELAAQAVKLERHGAEIDNIKGKGRKKAV